MMLAKCGVRHLPPMAIVLVYMVVMTNTEVVVEPTKQGFILTEDPRPTDSAILEIQTEITAATLYSSETTLVPTVSTTPSTKLIPQQQGINAGFYCPVFVSGENYTFVSELYTLTRNSNGLLPAVSVFVDSQSDTGQAISVVEYRCEATTEAGNDVQTCSSNKFDPKLDTEVSRLIPADSAQDFIYKLRVTFPAVKDFLEYKINTLKVMWEVDGIQYDTPLNCTVSNNSSRDLNNCSGNPCLNRGQCEDISDGYKCQCIPGYFGHQCGAVYRKFTCRYYTGVVSFQQTGSTDCRELEMDCYDPGSTDPLRLNVEERTVTPTTGVNQPTVNPVSTTDPNTVQLRVCNIGNVAVGNYQYEFKISNLNKEGDVSDFYLTVMVEDTPPKFNANIYRILVAQRVQKNQVIVPVNISKSMVCTQNLSCIQIIHPDSGRINLSISLIDDTDGVQNIQFAQKQEGTVSLGYFYLERDGFDGNETYLLTANVGPYSASATAVFTANKLCMPSRFNITIEDSFTAGHVLENLHCVDDTSGSLSLTLEGPHKYLFSIYVDSSGYWLTMVNDFSMSMPRDIPLTVYAKDGIDEMRYYFTVQLALLGCQVRNQSYPDYWRVGTTFTVFLECYNDVGSAGVEGATFEVIGVIPSDEKSLVEVTLEFKEDTYGNIDMNLTLFSSDGLIQQDMVLEIPVWNKISFTQDNYVSEIKADAPIGSSVVRVVASVAPATSIMYTLKGELADQIFAVDSQTGIVTTTASLTSYQWQTIRFQIEARDGVDGPPFTTNVEVFVVGNGPRPNQVNCSWESQENIVLQWNTPSGHIVNRLTCTDLTGPDLIFSIVDEDSLVQVSGDGTVKLIKTLTSTDAEAIQQVDILVENDRKTGIYSLFLTVQAFKYPFQAITLDEFSIGDTWVYFPFKQNQNFIREASERGWVKYLRIDCDGFFYPIFQSGFFNPLITFSNAQVIIRSIATQQTYPNCAMVWSFNGTVTDVSSRITFTTRNTISAQITPTPPVKYVMLDQSLSLSCELVERDEEICCPSLRPNFYWLQQNGKRIYRGKEVQIVLKSEDDLGSYTCYAELEFLNYTQTLSVNRAAAVFKANYTLSTNIAWVPELADNTSIPYTTLKHSLTRRINKLLEARPNYNGCEIVQFRLEEPRDMTMSSGHDIVFRKRRSTGIVLADVTTSELVGNVGDTTDIVSQLDQLVKSDNLTRPNDPEDIVLPHNISMTSSILLEKGSQSITALFLVFLPNSKSLGVSPKDNVIWTQDESKSFAPSSYDLEVNNVTVPQDFLIERTTSVYLLNTTLKITDMTQDDIGVYSCTINMPHHGIAAVSQIIDLTSRRFIKDARIRIDPPTQTVAGPNSIVFIQVYYANAERITCTGEVNSTTVVLSDQEQYRVLSFTAREERQIDCVAEAERIGDLRGVDAFDETIIKVAHSVTELCREVIERNITWAVAPVGSESRARCPPEYAEGLASRRCLEGAQWGRLNTSMCVKKILVDLDQQISNIESGLDNETALETVGSSIAQALNGSQITSGDIRQTVNTLVRVSVMAEDKEREPVSPETVKEFSLAADELLKADADDWENAQQQDGEVEQARLLVALDKMAESSLRSGRLLPEPLITETLAIKQGIVSQDGISFPQESEQLEQSWVKNSGSQVRLDKNAFPPNTTAKYSITVYRGEEDKFPTSKALQEKHPTGKHLAGKQLNSDVISVTVYPKPTSILAKPLELTYKVLDSENFTEADCAFLDTDTGELGLWSSTNCTKEHDDDGSVICHCTHLTNFAILMSPAGKPSSAHHEALSIITMVGCGISIFCLILKIIVYYVLWKYVKHDRSVLHVNLAVCLIIGYIAFLAGVDRTENEIACTVVAALLHFVFLAAFCIMLANGVEILISVTFVFERKSLLYKLLLISYGIPLVVVALTLGITKTEGYRSEDFCWLSVDSGVLWSFVGPALGVILVNYIIIIIVVRTMLNTATMMTKQARAKAKSIVKAIGVLCPIMGLTWVLGVFAVNDDLLFFQYCFAVVNSLQGLFIFIFHVLLCHQVKDGYRARKRRYRAKSFDSGQKLTTSSEFHSTTKRGSTDSHSGVHSGVHSGFQNQSFQHDMSSPSSSESSQRPLTRRNVQEEPMADYPSSQHLYETLDDNAGSDTQGSVRSGSVTRAYDNPGNIMSGYDIAGNGTSAYDNPSNGMSGFDISDNIARHNGGSGVVPRIQGPPPTAPKNNGRKASFKDFWRRISSRKKTKQEIDLERLRRIYGTDINPVRPDPQPFILNRQADGHIPHWKKTAKDRWHKVQQWAHGHDQNKWPRGDQTVMSDNMGYTAGPTRPNNLFKQSSREDVMVFPMTPGSRL